MHLTVALLLVAASPDVKDTELFTRVRAAINSMAAISTHDHLQAFDRIPGRVETEFGRGMTVPSIWAVSYFNFVHRLHAWPESGKFDDWWQVGQSDFRDARATSVYPYLLPAFRDLYGVDFDTITAKQARKLNEQIFQNYRDEKWAEEVVTRHANIELMFVDPYWARLQVERNYKFAVPVLNVSRLIEASPPRPLS